MTEEEHDPGTPDLPSGGMKEPSTAAERPSRDADEFVRDVVSRALEDLAESDDVELIRSSLTDTVSTMLRELADSEIERRRTAAVGNGHAIGGFAIGDAAEKGVEVAKMVKDLGFVEFTTGLVTGVFDTLTASTLKQMEGYAKLVNEIGSSLAQFTANNVSGAEVDANLALKYPDGSGGTVVRPSYKFLPTAEDAEKGIAAKTANEKLQEVASSLILATDDLPDTRKLQASDLTIAADAEAFTLDQVKAVRKAFSFLLAFDMRKQLQDMVREGMARIVVTRGEIETKLTFSINSTEIAAKQQANYHQDSAGVYINGSAGAFWGHINAGASWNQLNVRTVNEQSFDQMTMSADIIGRVKLEFKTETFPPRELTTGGE